MNKVYLADNLSVLASLPDESVDLVYIDPPFNTGKKQVRQNKTMVRVESGGEQQGFGGHQYVVKDRGEVLSYEDTFHDSYLSFLGSRLSQIHRILKLSGS